MRALGLTFFFILFKIRKRPGEFGLYRHLEFRSFADKGSHVCYISYITSINPIIQDIEDSIKGFTQNKPPKFRDLPKLWNSDSDTEGKGSRLCGRDLMLVFPQSLFYSNFMLFCTCVLEVPVWDSRQPFQPGSVKQMHANILRGHCSLADLSVIIGDLGRRMYIYILCQ